MGGREDNSRTWRPSCPGLKHLKNDLGPPRRASRQRRLCAGGSASTAALTDRPGKGI